MSVITKIEPLGSAHAVMQAFSSPLRKQENSFLQWATDVFAHTVWLFAKTDDPSMNYL